MKLAYEPQPRPKAIASLAGETIVKAACGTNHTGICTKFLPYFLFLSNQLYIILCKISNMSVLFIIDLSGSYKGWTCLHVSLHFCGEVVLFC